MQHKGMIGVVTLIAALVCAGAQGQETDFEGGKDYPELPRVDRTRINGYSFSEYDAGRFVSRFEGRKANVVMPEGKRTRIIYVGQETQSALLIFRNYQKAFSQFGEVDEVYSCQRDECLQELARDIVWATENRIPRSTAYDQHIYGSAGNFKDPMYYYGTVLKGDSQYHVSVFTAVIVSGPDSLMNRPIAHVEILEVEDFEPELVFIDADEMTSQLATQGHIALYGIQFDFDSASIKPASSPVVAEIAKALQAAPKLHVYVVGHSDNEGTLDYNQTLSRQRAGSVVQVLAETHGIDAGRLTAAGVGPVAPVSSNESEEGRALNRRVEIVKR